MNCSIELTLFFFFKTDKHLFSMGCNVNFKYVLFAFFFDDSVKCKENSLIINIAPYGANFIS